jgi:hypothetical protein
MISTIAIMVKARITGKKSDRFSFLTHSQFHIIAEFRFMIYGEDFDSKIQLRQTTNWQWKFPIQHLHNK